MPRGTTLRNVRIDDDRWNALRDAAEQQGTDASKVIREMIDVYLAGLDA
jgi:hypothetical protein